MKKIRFTLLISLLVSIVLSVSSYAAVETETLQKKEIQFQQIAEKQQKMIPKLDKIKTDFSSMPESFGGIYFDGDQAIVQIVGNNENVQKKILNNVVASENIITETVKYSQSELDKAIDTLNNTLNRDGSATWGLDTKNNKVIVYTNDESVKKKVIEIIDPELVSFDKSLNLVDQVGVGPSTWMNDGFGNCTVAFNAKVNTTNVIVTAGHCRQSLNQTWKVGTTNIGTFTQVTSSGTVDAGYITINSNASTGYIDTASNTPLGGYSSSDYVGLLLSVNYGTTKAPAEVASLNYTMGNFTNQRIVYFTTSTTTIQGSSGAPVVYRYYDSDLKVYRENIYGIHKAGGTDGSGNPIGVYGSMGSVFSALGLTSGIWAP